MLELINTLVEQLQRDLEKLRSRSAKIAWHTTATRTLALIEIRRSVLVLEADRFRKAGQNQPTDARFFEQAGIAWLQDIQTLARFRTTIEEMQAIAPRPREYTRG